MSTATGSSLLPREGQLLGQTVVVIGGSAGIGLETARLARDEGAKLVLAARNPEGLRRAASELGAQHTAAFDATDFAQLERFFNELPARIDHVLLTGPGPYGMNSGIPFIKIADRVEVDVKLKATRVSGPPVALKQ